MRSLINLIILVDFLFLGIIYIPSPVQAAPTQLIALIKQSAPAYQTLIGPDCLVYPFTARQTAIDSATPDVTVIDILDGPGPIDFGWLAWNPAKANDSSYLADELKEPQFSLNDFYNNHDPNDHTLSVGDYVASLPGLNGSIESGDGLLTKLIGKQILIPVWDAFHIEDIGGFSSDHYHISGFISVRIESAAGFEGPPTWLSSKNIYATYLGEVQLEQCPYLTLTKSGPATTTVGSPITYTLTLTNSGNLTATNLFITDTIPANATYVSGGTLVSNVVSWTVPTLPFSSSLTRTFSVTASQTITNSDYRASADGDVSTSGTVTVATTITPNLTITKSGPVTVMAGSLITYTLIVTNSGGLATNLVITDAIPTNAVYIGGGALVGNVVSWMIPSLDFSNNLTRTFSVTASQPITNSDYQVSADGNISATGTVSVATHITIDNEMARIYCQV